ncbi:MAG: MFS transporter [Anaerolineae bacterium]
MSLRSMWHQVRQRERKHTWVGPFIALVVLLFLGDFAVAPGRSLLSVYAEAVLGQPPYFTSTLLSVQTLFGAIAALVGGGLADTLGQKRVMILGASGLPLVGLVFLLGSPLALMVLWVYIGFTIGLYTIGRQSYMMAAVPPQYLGLATALIFTGLTLGSALGNALAAPVVDKLGFGALGVGILAVASLVFLVGLLTMPDMRADRRGLKSERSFAGYLHILRRPGVLLVGVVRILPTSYWGTATLLMPLLIYRAADRPSAAAYYGTASLLFASACQLLTGRICDRYGRRRLLVVLTGLISVISLLTSLFTKSLAGLYGCGILGAGIAWSLSTTIPGLVSDVAPREEHGRTLGLMHVFWSTGMLAGTQVGGWLVDVNSSLPFLVMGSVNILTVVSALILAPRLDHAREVRACSVEEVVEGEYAEEQ